MALNTEAYTESVVVVPAIQNDGEFCFVISGGK